MEPFEKDTAPQVGNEANQTGDHAVIGALEQLFTGFRVGLPSLDVRCYSCGSQLGDGDQVSVFAYRTVDTPRWHLARCQCPDCAPDEVTTSTLGTTEVRLRARLAVVSDGGMQQHRLCLAELTVNAVSPPSDGTPH